MERNRAYWMQPKIQFMRLKRVIGLWTHCAVDGGSKNLKRCKFKTRTHAHTHRQCRCPEIENNLVSADSSLALSCVKGLMNTPTILFSQMDAPPDNFHDVDEGQVGDVPGGQIESGSWQSKDVANSNVPVSPANPPTLTHSLVVEPLDAPSGPAQISLPND